MLKTEYIFEKVKFCSNLAEAEINSRNYQVNSYIKYQNAEFILNLISSENVYFESEINKIKIMLDGMTDICENSAILDTNILNSLKEFLTNHQNYIAKNIND